MPVGAGAGLKGDTAAAGAHGVVGGIQGIDAHGPGEKRGEPLMGVCCPQRMISWPGSPAATVEGADTDSGKQAAANDEQGSEASHEMISCHDRETRS